ncbi:HD domain-containing protein [Candidatus Uhrbacteria bacterium]|nr:HD domain-containing protein [Candidatus Uhrbacteria bacterium]
MLTKPFITTLFQGAYIQRWNDKLRPMEIIEIDKHAHKLIIAFLIGRYEERHAPISWNALIEGSVFEYLEKIVLTDIKAPVLSAIRKDGRQYKKLMSFVCEQLEGTMLGVDPSLPSRISSYLRQEDDTLEKRILSAASAMASAWEFDIIERTDPHGYEMMHIRRALSERLDSYRDLVGVQSALASEHMQRFINIVGQLRFQTRWAHVHRIPKTSVLMHSYFVAVISYFLSLQMNASARRTYNNTFAGLFHDLAEVLTRDIIAPVKRSTEGLRDLIGEYEKEQMEKIVYPLLPEFLHSDIRRFTSVEPMNSFVVDGAIKYATVAHINESYNDDRYDVLDGEIVKAADELSAYIESMEAITNGCASEKFTDAKSLIEEKYRGTVIGGVDLGTLYEDLAR